MSEQSPALSITKAIGEAVGPAICAYVTAGYPSRETFPQILRSVGDAADVVEVGVPFTDPMADGLTIQNASLRALEAGVTLEWIIDLLQAEAPGLAAPHLLMGYYNPFLAHGLDRLGESLRRSGTAGLIVPDLPIEESGPLDGVLQACDIALVQLVTPTTPPERLSRLAKSSRGFVYAVTATGVTGGRVELGPDDLAYLGRVGKSADLPVLAGFGIRHRDQVAAIAPYVDGVVVGSALLEAIDNGDDPGTFIESLRLSEVPA